MGKKSISIILISLGLIICNFTIISVSSDSIDSDSERNPIFGGIIIDTHENYNSSIPTKDAPSIAHIFTATWCTPCVEVEHAIEDVANETGTVMLTFHRFAGEKKILLEAKMPRIGGKNGLMKKDHCNPRQ